MPNRRKLSSDESVYRQEESEVDRGRIHSHRIDKFWSNRTPRGNKARHKRHDGVEDHFAASIWRHKDAEKLGNLKFSK